MLCIFFAELLHAGNLSIIRNTNQGKDFKIINPVTLRLNTYSNFKRIFKAAPAAPPAYSKHYIAPAPWQYWSKANQIIITTESTTTVSGTVTKSDGTPLFDFKCSAGTPCIKRFGGLPSALPIHPLNTVVSGAGLIVTATNASISVNLRNIASDELDSEGEGTDANIKGNASLFSFGDAGIGTSFRVGYYRDDNLAGNERPIYSIMALENNTTVKIAGAAVTTLNAGQSYLFQCKIGTLVESSGAAVMNTSARLDAPGGCGDGAYNPIPPIASLGLEYVIVRGEGNLIAEQTTIVSTEPDTKIHVEFFDENGEKKDDQDITIAAAGGFETFNHGWINGTYNKTSNTGRFSSSRIVSNKNILVFSGTGGVSGGGGCEVDIATLVPIASCAGSKQVETYKFTSYKNGDLPYFGYILTKSTNEINLTTKGTTPYTAENIENIPGIGLRKALGSSGLYLIKFTDANIRYPDVITINSASRLTVSMVQQSSNFSMSNFISRFPEKAEQPSVDLTDCTAAILTAGPSINDFYKWFLNGVEIAGANGKTYTATVSGNYTVSLNLECGLSAQSLPLIISLCNIDRSIDKTVDIALPEIDQVVTFTLKAKNLGTGNAIGVSVKDLLPSDYSYVSNTMSEGIYNPTTGLWTIGSMVAGGEATLVIKAKVVSEGTHRNNASITGTQADNNASNDKSWAETSTTPGELTLTLLGAADRSVCVNTPINDIVYLVGGGASGAVITGLPRGLTASTYDETTKTIKITGIPDEVTPFEGLEYTVTTTGGIRVSKTGRIIVKGEVGTPVFAAGLTSIRCTGAGNDTYLAIATNSESITYSLSPAESGSIDPLTGTVTWSAEYFGPAKITAKAIGCGEKTNDFSVMTYQRPATPSLNDINYCQYQMALPFANSLNGNKLIWYDKLDNRLADGYIPSTLNAGSTDFYLSQENSNGCESDKTKVIVTINALPLKPSTTDLTYCINQQNIQSLTAAGSNLTWYDSNGAVLTVAPTPVTTAVGATSYYVTQKLTVAGCESPKAELKVTILALPPAPATANLTYCQNQQNIPVLTAAGLNLTWYDANNNVLPGAPTPATSAIGETSYYVTQKLTASGCEGPKAELKVTINALPDAPVTANLTYCQNQQNIPVLTAAGLNLTWYDANNNVLPGVPTPVTSATGETSYYVTQKLTAAGCESPKAELKVTINALPDAPVTANLTYCQNQQNIPVLTAAGLNLTWYDANNNVLPGAPTPATSAAGETSYYVTQKLTAAGCESPKAELKVTINALPDAPVTANLTYCQNQQNIPVLTAAGLNLTWYDANNNVLPGAPRPVTSAAGETSYYVTQKLTAAGCESPKAELKVTINALPDAPVTANLTYCQNQQNIPVLTAGGLNLTWYDANNNVLPGAPTPVTSATGETSYYVTQKLTAAGCESQKTALKVTILALPPAPATANLTYCQNQQNIPVLTAGGLNLTWYDANNNVLPGAPTPATSAAGETIYYVTQKLTASGCEGPKAELKVTINALPDAPVTANLTYCQNQQNIPVLTAGGLNLTWYDANNNVLPGVPTPVTSAAGETSYYVTQKLTAAGCESPKAELKVTINALPDAPVTANLTYCQNQQNIPVLTAGGLNLTWYGANNNVLPGVPTPVTSATGETSYYVTQKLTASGCEGPKAELKVTINALPDAPVTANLTYCQNQQNIPVLTAAGLNLTWYDANNNVLPGAPTPATSAAGETIYYVTQKLTAAGCEGPKAVLKVTINALPDAPVTANLTYCQNQQNIPVLTAAGSNLTWYDANNNVLPGAPTPATSAAGETIYYVTQKLTAAGCEGPKAVLKVTINALPDAPVTANLTYCQDQQNIPVLTAAGSNLTWYDANNNVLPGVPTPVTSATGETSYYVTQKLTAAGCEGPKAALKVTILALPPAPATANLTYCQNQQNIPVLTAGGLNLTWYDANNNVLPGVPTPVTSATGETSYYVTQKLTASGCEGPKAELKVTINALPDAPVTANLTYCQNQQNIPVLTAAGLNLTWYDANNNVLPGAPTPATSATGETSYYVTQKLTAAGCESPKAELKVTINALPDAPVTANLTYCQNQQNIPVLTAGGLNLTWYDANNNVLPGAPTPATSAAGETSYYVTQKLTAAGCESPKAELKVTINALPDAPVTANLTYCQDQQNIPVLTAAGSNLTWYDANNNVLPGVPTPVTSATGETSYYVTQKLTAAGCEGPKAALKVTILALPPAPATATANLTYCQNQQNIPVLTAGGLNLTWYDANNNVLPGVPTPVTSATGETSYYVTQKLTASGCEGPKAALKVTILALPPAPKVSDLNYCLGQKNVPPLFAEGKDLVWYDSSGSLLSSAPIPSTAVSGTMVYFVAERSAQGCPGLRSKITISINEIPVAPFVKKVTYCQNESASKLQVDGSNLKWYDEQGNLLPSAPVPVTSAVGTTNYYVSQTNSSGCESTKSKITVEIFAAPEKPVISASGPVLLCEGGSVILKSSPSTYYQWFKDGEVLSGAVGQALTVTEAGLYKVITKNASGCSSGFSEGTNVLVNKIPQKPTISAQGPLNVCEGQAVVLNSSSPTGNQWYKDGILIPGATEQTYLTKLTGQYTVVINTSSGCSSIQSEPIPVSVNSRPVMPDITTQSSLSICKGGVATLTSSVSSGNQWYKNGVLIPGATGATYVANSAGTYTVKSKNSSGCESLNSNEINLKEEEFRIALQANSDAVEYGSKIELNTSSKLSYKILSWSPNNIFIEGDAKSQSIVLLKNVTVTVNAVSENGCYASATINIQIDKKRDLFIPNTFTPNGDGKNDVVKVYATGIEMIDWAVYSQWGQLIYKSKAQDASWDGTFGGVMQPVGVYVYKCIVRFNDGEEITRHGAINLVR